MDTKELAKGRPERAFRRGRCLSENEGQTRASRAHTQEGRHTMPDERADARCPRRQHTSLHTKPDDSASESRGNNADKQKTDHRRVGWIRTKEGDMERGGERAGKEGKHT